MVGKRNRFVFQQLLDYKFDKELETRLKRARLLAESRSISVQNKMQYVQNTAQHGDFIVHGTDNEAACLIFGTLQSLIREKYAIV